jgi:hypothetical protein
VNNEPAEELDEARRELRKIARLRLEMLVAP